MFQPVYGFATRDFIPFRYASGNGRSVHFHEDTELDLTQYLKSRQVPKVLLGSNLRCKFIMPFSTWDHKQQLYLYKFYAVHT